jgi:hypothetical protein
MYSVGRRHVRGCLAGVLSTWVIRFGNSSSPWVSVR